MEQNKKLSLKEEVEREARKIEEEIENNSDLDDIKVSDKMEESLLAKIRAYEKKCASEHENKNVRMEGAAEELSEELAPNFATRTNEDNVVHLSAEDMEALRLGRELMKKKSKEEELFEVHTEYHKHLNSDNKGKEGKAGKGEKAKRIHMPRRRKFVVALAAVMVLVLAVGMTSVGSKSYLKVLWEKVIGDEKAEILNVEDMVQHETSDELEINAYKEIGEELGISAVRLRYKPVGMYVKDINIDEEQKQAQIFFEYGDEVIRYMIYMNNSDSSLGQKTLDKLINEFEVKTDKQTIKVEEYEVEEYKTPRFIATFSYRGVHYQLKGIMEKEEFEKILKNLSYFSKGA